MIMKESKDPEQIRCVRENCSCSVDELTSVPAVATLAKRRRSPGD